MDTVEIHTTVGPLVIIRLLGANCRLDDTRGHNEIVNRVKTADRRTTIVVRRALTTDPIKFEREYVLDIKLLPTNDRVIQSVTYAGTLTLLSFMKTHLADPFIIRDNNSVDHLNVTFMSGLEGSFAQLARGRIRDDGRHNARLVFQNVE